MTIDRAELFRLAWVWARADEAFRWVYDWTPGRSYGRRRTATPTDRRAVFARHLARAWAEMKRQAAYRAQRIAAFAAARPAEDIRADILSIECKDRLCGSDRQRLEALYGELYAPI